jgi:hypothetical protein
MEPIDLAGAWNMHVRELVELGAYVATHGVDAQPHASHPLLAERHAQQYWLAAHCRHHRWQRVLKAFSGTTPERATCDWLVVRPVLSEILASELLTRVWAAVACDDERHEQPTGLAATAQSVLARHTEIRIRVMHWIARSERVPVSCGAQMNHLRRLTERWTDMLLGFLGVWRDVQRYAFDAKRAGEFSRDWRDLRDAQSGLIPWALSLVSLRSAFGDCLRDACPNADLNARIAASVLACFPHDWCDWSGWVPAHWLMRLEQSTDDTEALLSNLLNEDAAPVVPVA